MVDIVSSANWTDAAEKMAASIEGASFRSAVLRMALDIPLADLTSIEADLHSEAEKYVLVHSFGRTFIDKDGRVEKFTRRCSPATMTSDERLLGKEMFMAAARSKWPRRCVAMILPMQAQIRNEHNPTINDLLLAQGNLLVPPGHEGIVLHGLLAGIQGDFLVASHLLVPQFGSSIRFLLHSFGIETVSLMEDRTPAPQDARSSAYHGGNPESTTKGIVF